MGKVRFGVASAHLQNTLYPERARLEALIAADEALIAQMEAEMAAATHAREVAQATYERNVNECMALLAGLMDGAPSFVEISKAQRAVKKVAANLKVSTAMGHLAKALVQLAQEFADGAAVGKVQELFSTLLGNLHTSRHGMDAQNVREIEVYTAFMTASQNTIDQANARIAANQADLDVVNAEIAHQEDLRDTAADDRDTAQADLDEETARWDERQANYEAYMAELKKELDAIDACIGVFSSFDMSDEMLARVDW